MARENFVSVIVPARNAARVLPDCLAALDAQVYPRDLYEVIVVDDGSTDETATVADGRGVKVIRIPPSGPGAARNRGVEKAKGDLLLFTDADCLPDPGWIRALVRPFDDPQVAAAKGIYRSDQRSWTARFVQAEYESRYRLMARRESIDFVDTYAAAYRRRAFEEVGGFDESFPGASVEDQELSFRLAERGATMVFCPQAVVGHRHAADPVAYFRKKMKIGYWKMKVLARYPGKAVSDSHTPSTLKAEILLVAAAIATLPLGPLAGLHWLSPLFLGAFFAVCAPFCVSLLGSRPAVALRAPFFLLARSVALGLGMAGGLAGAPFRCRREERRMERAAPERATVEHDA